MSRLWALVVLVFALCAEVSPAEAAPLRILIAAGHRSGSEGERPLLHANRDAERVRDVMVALGGVPKEAAWLLADPTPEELLGAFDAAFTMARARAPDDVSLLFYFSGHGDHQRLHLGKRSITLAEIAARIRGIPATVRMAVLDACRSFDGRTKGMSIDAPFSIAVAPAGATGMAWLHATTDGDVAQESDDLGGAIFTHYWVSGLRGAADADGDRRVTLGESYAFAYNQTLFRSARASGTLQRANAVLDLRESAPVVLTVTSPESSALRFPQGADAHYLVFLSGANALAGELWSSPDRPILLALPAGRYVVQRRLGGARAAALELTLGSSEQRELRPSDFRAVPEEVLVRKGGDLVLFPHEVALGYAPGAGTRFSLTHRVSAQYTYRFEPRWALAFALEGELAFRRTAAYELTYRAPGLAARVEHRWPVGKISVIAGAGPVAAYLFESLRRRDAATLAGTPYPLEESNAALAVGGELSFSLRVSVGARAFLEPGGAARVLGINAGGVEAYVTAGGGLRAGAVF